MSSRQKYSVILADPPWAYANRGVRGAAAKHYATLSPVQIQALPVSAWAADDAVLVLWCTNPMLPEGLKTIESWGFCVGVGTNILTNDLRWLPAEDLKIGDKLLAFDEKLVEGRRFYRTSSVLSTGVVPLPSYRIVLNNGKELIASSEHAWLMRSSVTGKEGVNRWIKTKDLPKLLADTRRKYPLSLPRLAPKTEIDRSYEGGFLAVAFDSEGHLSADRSHLVFTQRDNVLLATVARFLTEKGFEFAWYAYDKEKGVVHLRIRRGLGETMRFLSTFRPPRLLEKWEKLTALSSLYNLESVPIECVEDVGYRDCVTLTTSTGTYIAEGFGAHNTYVTKLPWIKFVGDPRLDKDGNIVEGDLAWGTGWWARGVSEDILLARRGVVKPPDQATAGLLGLVAKRDKHSNKPVAVQEFIEQAWPGPYLELFARQIRPGWDVWGEEIPSSIDLLQNLPADYLQDTVLHQALARIKFLWDTGEKANWEIGDILGELCKTLVPPYTKTDLWRLAAAQMKRVNSHHFPMLMQHISATFKREERSAEKSWNTYRKQYDLIRAVKTVTRQQERERHRAISEYIDEKFGFVDRRSQSSPSDETPAPHA